MALGTKTLTGGGGTEEVVAADKYRGDILIQLQSDHPAYFGFGEDAVTLEGISLIFPGDTIEVKGSKARGAINAIAAGNAVLGFETGVGVKYRSGQFAGPWPAS